MSLTPEQIALAQSRLADLLDPLKSEGARLTLSPVLKGPMSKGEVQIFYAGSNATPPSLTGYNGPWSQTRTLNWQVNLLLKDLNQPEAAVPLLEQVKALLTGAQLFGPFLQQGYEGGLYVVRDSFRRLNEQAFWYYELTLGCQIDDFLPLPYEPPLDPIPE